MSLETASSAVANATSSSWFLPRFIGNFLDAVDQQAVEYLESVESLKNGTFTGKELEFPTFIRVLQNLNYFISPYAAGCMIMAVVLNRTLAFASSTTTGRNLNINRFNHYSKKGLRILTIGLLLNVLFDVIKVFALNYEFFNEFLSQFYKVDPSESIKIGALLWKVFISFCISNFIETLISVNSGQLPFYDTALTLFEHSLAFQESRYSRTPSSQLLTIVISSICNQIVVQLFGLFNLKKYQLIPSAIFGFNLIFICTYNFLNNSLNKIPIILILSIMPQIIVILMASICLVIYFLAVLINGTSEGLTYTPMISNMRESLNFQLNEDFNSLVTRFGIIMFNALDNDEYVYEFSSLTYQTGTYLDNDKGYLISNYFNKIDDFPDSKQEKKPKLNNSIATLWSLIKRYISVFNLVKTSIRFVINTLFRKKRKAKSEKQLDQQLEMFNVVMDDVISGSPNQLRELLGDEENANWDFDYSTDNDSETEALEYDSDALSEIDSDSDSDIVTSRKKTTYIGSISEQRIHDAQGDSYTIPANASSNRLTVTSEHSPLDELFQPKDILSLINPSSSDAQDLSTWKYIRSHLSQDTRLTRSGYYKLNQEDLLGDLISERRPHNHSHNNHTNSGSSLNKDEIITPFQDDFTEPTGMECVVCQTNPRNIIIWPCKCFALCESCRLSLGVRGFSHCVCCRRQVDGFSKVFLP